MIRLCVRMHERMHVRMHAQMYVRMRVWEYGKPVIAYSAANLARMFATPGRPGLGYIAYSMGQDDGERTVLSTMQLRGCRCWPAGSGVRAAGVTLATSCPRL